MTNRHRGEVEAVLDGSKHTLVLTLGALAELEAAFGDADMVALAERFEKGRIAASDCVRIIGAGLRGAGYDVSDFDVANMQADGGAAGYVKIVAELLAATFGAAAESGPEDAGSGKAASGTGGAGQSGDARGPFLGMT